MRPHAITQDDTRDAVVIKPLSDFMALVVVGEDAVAATRTNDDCRTSAVSPLA